MEIYLVGGAVRDKLLDLQVFDRDWVVVGATVEEMISQGYKPVGDDFPVFLHPETKEEYALARTERKTAKGYRGFQFHASPDVTLEQDLQRRDLTINAIAEDLNGNLIDPSNGLADIKARKLRHVSEAFTEDPVRVLRVARLSARFAPQGFTIADQTRDLLQNMVDNGEVDALVPERVWQEMDKALSEPTARIFFETLRSCGALKVLMPELDKLFGVPQPEKWHPEIDTGLHTMMALDQICQLSDQNATRFAIICHDLGKGQTPKADLPSHPGHEALSAELTLSLCRRLKSPTSYRDLASLVARFHTHVHRALELNARTLAKTLSSLDISRKPERFEQFLLACEADARGRLGLEERDYPQAEWFRKAAAAYLDVDAGAIAQAVMAKAQANNTSPDKNNIANDIHQARVRSIKHLISTR